MCGSLGRAGAPCPGDVTSAAQTPGTPLGSRAGRRQAGRRAGAPLPDRIPGWQTVSRSDDHALPCSRRGRGRGARALVAVEGPRGA